MITDLKNPIPSDITFTGIKLLDRITCGFELGDLTIIIGKPRSHSIILIRDLAARISTELTPLYLSPTSSKSSVLGFFKDHWGCDLNILLFTNVFNLPIFEKEIDQHLRSEIPCCIFVESIGDIYLENLDRKPEINELIVELKNLALRMNCFIIGHLLLEDFLIDGNLSREELIKNYFGPSVSLVDKVLMLDEAKPDKKDNQIMLTNVNVPLNKAGKVGSFLLEVDLDRTRVV